LNTKPHFGPTATPQAGWPMPGADAVAATRQAQVAGCVSREQARACSRQLATGVSVVTTCDLDSQPYGLTVSAVLSVSLEPSMFLVSVAETSRTLAPLLRRGAFVINILAAGQELIAEAFASQSGNNKFAHVAYELSAEARLPLLGGALAMLECRLVHAYAGGDHRLVVGEVSAMRMNSGLPLLRYDGRYLGIDRVRHASDRAP
jgi:3-hydroxy-9,10-secoandrosta-1,3,5(10)-triene-9,17-dione monooxygenase reductase component